MSGRTEGNPRLGNRIRASVPAELHWEGRTSACQARNISRTGVLVISEIAVPSGKTLEFSLSAPTGSLNVRLVGRVIRVAPQTDRKGFRIALKLVDMDDSRRDALEALLARVLESPPAGPFDRLKPGASPQEIKKALEAIPLPQRIALSSRAGTKDREVLRLDTHPAVLDALAHDPSLTPVEARALATSVHLMPGTIEALANDLRFKADDELRVAVAAHPKVSAATAMRVTADLKAPQLKRLLEKPGLNPLLRDKLRRRAR